MKRLDESALARAVGLDVRGASVAEMVDRMSTWDPLKRSELLRRAGEAARGDQAAANEGLRIGLAKALVALLPDSYEVISQLLEWRAGVLAYELHFSLFCFLGDNPEVTADPLSRDRMATLVEAYLRTVRVGTAHASGMAGDLLGEHWPVKEAVPRLVRLAANARFVAGRQGALDGLAAALGRAQLPTQRQIVAAMRTVAETDRSSKIRDIARYFLLRAPRGIRINDG